MVICLLIFPKNSLEMTRDKKEKRSSFVWSIQSRRLVLNEKCTTSAV